MTALSEKRQPSFGSGPLGPKETPQCMLSGAWGFLFAFTNA